MSCWSSFPAILKNCAKMCNLPISCCATALYSAGYCIDFHRVGEGTASVNNFCNFPLRFLHLQYSEIQCTFSLETRQKDQDRAERQLDRLVPGARGLLLCWILYSVLYVIYILCLILYWVLCILKHSISKTDRTQYRKIFSVFRHVKKNIQCF